jgi:hypothetical protein
VLEILAITLAVAAAAVLAFKFFRRYVSRTERPTAPPLMLSAASRTQAQQDASRAIMEREVVQAGERRGATDKRP